MKIKTNYVPEKCDYLTAGKEYEVVQLQFRGKVARIVNDDGDTNTVFLESSAHLDGHPWEVVEE